tara:strand:- start:471 stop:1187 length:717 start_codon:yes stop_codon:yes gene_type:complete
MTLTIKINEKNKEVNKDINIFNQNKNKGSWFVKYYASWCPHCVNMQSEWDKLEKNELLKNKNIHIAEVEESFFNQLDFKPDVIGFPTIKFYNNGDSQDFKGNRTTENMVSFLKDNHKNGQKYQTGGRRNLKSVRRNKKTKQFSKKNTKRNNKKNTKRNKKKKGKNQTSKGGSNCPIHCNYWSNVYKKQKKLIGKSEAQSSAINGDLNKQYLRSFDYQLNPDKQNLAEYLKFCNNNNCH